MRKKLENSLKRIKIDEVLEMKVENLTSLLVHELNIFKSENDLKLFIIEGIQEAFNQGDIVFPINYKKVK